MRDLQVVRREGDATCYRRAPTRHGRPQRRRHTLMLRDVALRHEENPRTSAVFRVFRGLIR